MKLLGTWSPLCDIAEVMGNFAEMARHVWRTHQHAADLGDCRIEIECEIHGWQEVDATSIDGGCELRVHEYHSSLI